MTTALLDAAFQLVSHSVTVQKARIHPLTKDDTRLAELRRQFPEAQVQGIEEAYACARHLEEIAIAMADLARGSRNDDSGPPLNEVTLAERCPGFSSATYALAISDGYMLTRK